MEKLPTECRALDPLTDGGLPTGTITQVFGEKALGKSILCFQAACATVAAGEERFRLDTEQSYMSYLVEYRLPGMLKRFGKEIPVKEVKMEGVPKTAKKKGVQERAGLRPRQHSNQRGVGISEGHLSSVADTLCPEFEVQVEVPTGHAS